MFIHLQNTEPWFYIKVNSKCIRDINVKLRYHFKPIRMAKSKKTNNNKCLQRHGTITLRWWESRMVVTLKHSMAVSYKFQHTLTIRTINFILGYLLKKNDNICQHKDLYLNTHSSITQLHTFFKFIEVYIFLKWILLYVNYTSTNLTCKKHFIPVPAPPDSIQACLNTSCIYSHSFLCSNSYIILFTGPRIFS